MNMIQELKVASAHDILHWVNPKLSAMALSLTLLVWFIFFHGAQNLLTTCCRIFEILMLVGAINRLGFLNISEETMQAANESSHKLIRRMVQVLYPLLVWQNPGHSMVALLISILGSVLSWFISYSTAILCLIVFIFAAPMAYKKNQKLVDSKLEIVNNKVNGVLKKRGKSGVMPSINEALKESAAKLDKKTEEVKREKEELEEGMRKRSVN